MTTYGVMCLETGWAVVRINIFGEALVMIECATEASAVHEARRMRQSQQQAAQRAAVRGMVRAELGRRATSARYFEPEPA